MTDAPSMPRIKLAPDHEISRVIKGGWQLATDHNELRAADPVGDMVAFADAGITTFDCADIYTGVEELVGRFRLRYRIDGMMQEMKSPPKQLQASIIARLKISAGMVISEHRIPQDGRIQTKVGNKLIDLRVSCLPTNHGESIVMRILTRKVCGSGWLSWAS